MAQRIEFAKLSGSGNDFICVDNRDGRHDRIVNDAESVGRFARTLCTRGTGIGADGLIFAVAPEIEEVADIGARVFEADGSEAELCGNGTACFIHWVFTNRWITHEEMKILTPAGVVRGMEETDGYVRVCVPLPEDLATDCELDVDGRTFKYDYVCTGVPHVVTWVDDVARADLPHWGPAIRHHPEFQPRGANANFVELLDIGEIAVRTWEFGVEGETLACGTGSASSAILTALRENWPGEYLSGGKPVLVHARSGDVLRIYFTREADGTITDVCLETLVRYVYTGEVHPQLHERAIAEEPEEPAAV